MIGPDWVQCGGGKLRRAEGDVDGWSGQLEVVGYPYHLIGYVEWDAEGKHLSLRVYSDPPRRVAAAMPPAVTASEATP